MWIKIDNPSKLPPDDKEVIVWRRSWGSEWVRATHTGNGTFVDHGGLLTIEGVEYWMDPNPQQIANLPELALVVNERISQIYEKEWDLLHDERYNGSGELVLGAISYAKVSLNPELGDFPPREWPWDLTYWKPVDVQDDPTRNLVKAAAMLLAEARLRHHLLTKVSQQSSR